MQELYIRFHGFINKTKSNQFVFSMTFTGVKAYLRPNQRFRWNSFAKTFFSVQVSIMAIKNKSITAEAVVRKMFFKLSVLINS